jgi:toxin-antitoxin system PIN domain toxin
VIAVDTNVLVYAHRRDLPLHRPARDAVGALASGRLKWAIPWPCVHEFLAVVTNARVFRQPTPVKQAMRQVQSWLDSPTATTLAEDERYLDTLKALLESSGISGGKVHDARIAALCLHHAVDELWSADRDFSRFPALKTRNPLVG